MRDMPNRPLRRHFPSVVSTVAKAAGGRQHWGVTEVVMEGSCVDSGSDPEMDGMDGGELESTENSNWTIVENRKRKKMRDQTSGSDSERERERKQVSRPKEEYKLMIKFLEESANVLNPIKITKALKEAVGKIDSAKRVRDGRLLLLCHDKKQQKAAVGLKSLLGIKVLCTMMEERK